MQVAARLLRAVVALLLGAVALEGQRRPELVVGSGERFGTLAAALAEAMPGSTIRVKPGIYREPTIEVHSDSVTIIGEGRPTFDGEGARQILIVRGRHVTLRGLRFENTGITHMEDRAAVRVVEGDDCRIEDNEFVDALFAIYLQRAAGCIVRGNLIRGGGAGESSNGNGVHLWHSPNTQVLDNRISGQRDGIYFEFSVGALAAGNVSEANSRYGLHFMFSDSCRYERNRFVRNHAGVAVMYSKGITMVGNDFIEARGSAAYALLLKEITDGALIDNRFVGSSTGLYLEGASRLEIRGNEFRANGWAVRLMADALDNRFTANRFAGNAFDVTTNSRTVRSSFDGNYWDGYRGYDLDRDGRGDVPFHPVRFFALVVEKHPEALLLLRSPVTAVLDAAERVFPVLTPSLADPSPLMRPPQ